MVKTLHGRKPGRRHARIVKKLRHRRRMEARRVAVEDAECHTSCTITSSSYGTTTGQLPSPFLARPLVEYPLTESSSTTSVSTPATVSTASTASLSLIERAHEMEYLPLPQRRLYFTPSEVNALLSFDEDDAKDAVVEKVSDAPVAEDKQMVLYKARAARGRKARGVSESINVSGGFAGRSIDRTVVSESDLHPTAIPMPPPPHSAPAAVAASTTVAAPVDNDDLPDIEEDHPSDPIIAAPPPSSHHAVSPNVVPHPVVGNSSNDQPLIIYTTICLSCGGKAITRGHLVAAGGNIGNHVSESNFHPTAVTVAAPSAAPQDAAPAATGHQGHFLIDHPTATVLPHHAAADHHDDHNRQQHPDEVTDRYLSHLFTPSIANLTTAAVDELSHHENSTTRTDDYHHFRGIFSTDHHPSHHSFARQPSTSTSDATSWGLNALYRHNNDRTANGISANGMDEYTSLNDTATDDYRHFRNIFSTEHHPHHSSAATATAPPRSEATWGLNTLFNGRTRHPSVGTLSAIWEELTTTSDTSSDDFRRLRNLFSSDSQHTAPATTATTAPPPRQQQHTTVSSDETSMGLNALFNNNDRTVRQVSSHDNDTSLGLRTLFDEKSNHD